MNDPTASVIRSLGERVRGLSGTLDDYDDQRLIEYEIAVLYPPMASPGAFLRDARDPAIFDAIVKDDTYDGIPRWTADLQATSALVERLMPAWQWVVWGGAIEIGHTKPRCMASINDGHGGRVFDASDRPTPALALLSALLSALTKES